MCLFSLRWLWISSMSITSRKQRDSVGCDWRTVLGNLAEDFKVSQFAIAGIEAMRYVASLLVGLGMHLMAIAAWEVFGSMFIPPIDLQIHDFYILLPPIIGHAIGIVAFVAGFYWMFRRTSARNSD